MELLKFTDNKTISGGKKSCQTGLTGGHSTYSLMHLIEFHAISWAL